MNSKLLKLARLVLKFMTTMVGEVEWVHEGELAVGVEVYTEDENGELIPVADGEYETENMKIVVKDGKIEELNEITPEPEPEPEPQPEPEPEPMAAEPTPEPEPQPDEKDAKITELTNKIAELETKIAVLVEEIDNKNDLIEELQEKLVKPVEQPITMSATLRDGNGKQSGAMKYFE